MNRISKNSKELKVAIKTAFLIEKKYDNGFSANDTITTLTAEQALEELQSYVHSIGKATGDNLSYYNNLPEGTVTMFIVYKGNFTIKIYCK